MRDGRVVLGITQGDTNGVGFEVMLRTLQDGKICEQMYVVLYGSGKALAYYRRMLRIGQMPLGFVRDASEAELGRLNVVDCIGEDGLVTAGVASQKAGQHAMISLEAFFNDWRAGLVDALVTLPVNKQTMLANGFQFAGHTEYLAQQCGQEGESLMLMVSPTMRIAVVTHHVPLREVAQLITKELVKHRIHQLHKTLYEDFGISGPRIAVLGLNPHAGDGGALGNEELDTIGAAVEEANREGLIAVGPLAPDGFFGSTGWVHYDAVLAMYHDQGLIPFKLVAFHEGVNYTAGLQLVRTSPAHGTAYDIVGHGVANCGSFRQAVFLAQDVVKHRARIAETVPLNSETQGNASQGEEGQLDTEDDA